MRFEHTTKLEGKTTEGKKTCSELLMILNLLVCACGKCFCVYD